LSAQLLINPPTLHFAKLLRFYLRKRLLGLCLG